MRILLDKSAAAFRYIRYTEVISFGHDMCINYANLTISEYVHLVSSFWHSAVDMSRNSFSCTHCVIVMYRLLLKYKSNYNSILLLLSLVLLRLLS